jgi:hypothetical protein
MQKKNVDYAAYEYNVYVRCDYRGKNSTEQQKKKGGGGVEDSPMDNIR